MALFDGNTTLIDRHVKQGCYLQHSYSLLKLKQIKIHLKNLRLSIHCAIYALIFT